jgi:hypothetical protein
MGLGPGGSGTADLGLRAQKNRVTRKVATAIQVGVSIIQAGVSTIQVGVFIINVGKSNIIHKIEMSPAHRIIYVGRRAPNSRQADREEVNPC